MSNEFESYEPLPDHLADTGPNRPVQDTLPLWRRAVGLFSILGAAGLTIATALLLIAPEPTASTDVQLSGAAVEPNNTQTVQQVNPVAEVDLSQGVVLVNMIPTADPALVASLLSTPVAVSESQDGIEIVRDTYDPFTVIPDRPRSEVIQYTVVEGDTIFTIAERFGLKPESIAWANDRSIIGGLRPGRNINILPVDGAYFTVAATESIQSIADEFGVDPFVIIDSEFNDLFGATPETVLTSGTQVVVPGGEAEQISWNPTVEREEGTSGGGGGTSGGRIIFEPGDPGSCGWVDNPGGGGGWFNPMGGGYSWSRGFTSWHTGVDLAAPEGTPVKAANGGTVVFRGWNTYGYGYAVVLAHGPYTTLYGHLSNIYVGCGQWVDAGTVIAGVGTTGQSSGPHLHFEIRYNDVPQDPTFTMPF